jgi:hypothetical protein
MRKSVKSETSRLHIMEKRIDPQDPPPQPPVNAGNRRRHYFVNCHLEKSAVKQFVFGSSVASTANAMKVTEQTVEQALRETILDPQRFRIAA